MTHRCRLLVPGNLSRLQATDDPIGDGSIENSTTVTIGDRKREGVAAVQHANETDMEDVGVSLSLPIVAGDERERAIDRPCLGAVPF